MGRGRQKAKHTKVARELKYYSPDTDYSALQQELGSGDRRAVPQQTSDDAQDERSDERDDDGNWAVESSR